MKTVGIVTLGCRVNQYESVALAEELRRRGFEIKKDEAGCDFYLVNTCAVTAESQRQCRQTVRRLASMAPTAVIGCAPQAAENEFASMENVFYVGGCDHKMAAADAIEHFTPALAVSPMEHAGYEKMSLSGESDLFSTCRGYLKIQDGCSGKCTYCIISALRGPTRSRPTEDILAEASRMVQNGYKELVLTGIETSAFHSCRLEDLIERLGEFQKDGLARLRLGSLSSGTLRKEFLSKVSAVPIFMPHIHLSLQSGSDAVLERMRRPDRRAQMDERISLLKDYIPSVQISADLITGFPGETEEDYLMTESLVKKANFLHVHAFPYSERPGTPAAEMDGKVEKEVRKERCKRLNALSDGIRETILRGFAGKTVTVLIEKVQNGVAVGHSEEFIECHFPAKGHKTGELVSVLCLGQDGKSLLCE